MRILIDTKAKNQIGRFIDEPFLCIYNCNSTPEVANDLKKNYTILSCI